MILKYNVAAINLQMKRLVWYGLIASLLSFAWTFQPALAVITVDWDSATDEQNLNDGAVGGGTVTFTIVDSDLAADPAINTIEVTITSTQNPTGIVMTLTETGGGTGTFQNTNLIFTNGTALFPTTGTVTVTRNDPATNAEPGFDPGVVDTVGAAVISTTDSATGITLELVETGPNTGLFTNKLRFTTAGPSDDANNILHVSLGDTVSLLDPVSNQISNALIIPNSDPTIGAIEADIGDSVIVSYGGVSDTLTIIAGAAGGGGGGGLIRTGLVLDVIASLIHSGSSDDVFAPTFSIAKSLISTLALPADIFASIVEADPFTPLAPIQNPQTELPLLIGNNGYPLTQYANTIETYVAETGKPIEITLNFRDSSGLDHVALYTNLRETQREISDSDTYIIYDEDNFEIVDPQGFFYNIGYNESKTLDRYAFTLYITFAKPMDTSDIIVRAWDTKRNSGDTKIFNAWKVVGEPIVDNTVQTETISFHIPYFMNQKYIIPEPDEDGYITYFNTFGEIENKRVHPFKQPFAYPDYVARSERHDASFWDRLVSEEERAFIILDSLIIEPLDETTASPNHLPFLYPDDVGRLDRKIVLMMNQSLMYEDTKAKNFLEQLYKRND